MLQATHYLHAVGVVSSLVLTSWNFDIYVCVRPRGGGGSGGGRRRRAAQTNYFCCWQHQQAAAEMVESTDLVFFFLSASCAAAPPSSSPNRRLCVRLRMSIVGGESRCMDRLIETRASISLWTLLLDRRHARLICHGLFHPNCIWNPETSVLLGVPYSCLLRTCSSTNPIIPSPWSSVCFHISLNMLSTTREPNITGLLTTTLRPARA